MKKERLTQNMIENGLDSMIVNILVSHNSKELERFGTAIKVLKRHEYDLRNYEEIYQELKEDINNWRIR